MQEMRKSIASGDEGDFESDACHYDLPEGTSPNEAPFKLFVYSGKTWERKENTVGIELSYELIIMYNGHDWKPVTGFMESYDEQLELCTKDEVDMTMRYKDDPTDLEHCSFMCGWRPPETAQLVQLLKLVSTMNKKLDKK